MVQDDRDRWWSKHPETGEWHYYDGTAWVRGAPPGYEEVAPDPIPSRTPVETAPEPLGKRPATETVQEAPGQWIGRDVGSPVRDVAGLIRLGVLALPLAGLLALVSRLVTLGSGVNPRVTVRDFSTPGYVVNQFVGDILPFSLVIFGVIALFAYLVNTRGGLQASFAMVLSIAGIALGLLSIGVTTYALPVVVDIATGSMDTRLVNGLFYYPLLIISNLLSFLLYSVGAILFGVAVWRSGSLPKWAGILYAVHAPLLWVTGIHPIAAALSPIVGTVLLVLGGGWIALSIFRGPSAGEMGAEAEPRVRS